MGIIVQRIQTGDKAKPGGSIISSILTDKQSQLERGRHEINKHSKDRNIETASLFDDLQFKKPSKMAFITGIGKDRIGLIRTFSLEISMNGDDITTSPQIRVEIPK